MRASEVDVDLLRIPVCVWRVINGTEFDFPLHFIEPLKLTQALAN